MTARLIEEDLLTKQRIIHKDLPEGQVINAFLLSRAKALAGKYIDFDKTPVTFLLSEREDPNAFFAPISEFQNRPRLRHRRDEREDNIIYTPNPYETPIICVTKGLIDMVDNLDELDYVLAHELTHLIIRGYGVEKNSKGEETIADLHAIDLIYDAGGDPKQALAITDKINVYSEKQKNKDNWRGGQEKGINWSEVLNVHMTHINRRSALEASLTRISHLIDDRNPSRIDKSVFSTEYTDQIDELLKEQNYSDQEPLEKLKILIDMVETLSESAPYEKTVKKKLESLAYDTSEGFISEEEQVILKLRDRYHEHYKGYYSGKVMLAKHKQKIAELSEEVFRDYYKEELEKIKKRLGNEYDPVKYYGDEIEKLDTTPLVNYVQNKAYDHIKKYGYPHGQDMNYHDASSMLYNYFYSFLEGHIPNDVTREQEINSPKETPEIINDIKKTILKTRNAKTIELFKNSYKKLQELKQTLIEIRSPIYGCNDISKFDNLSFIDNNNGQFHGTSDARIIFEKESIKPGFEAPWNNLTKISKKSEEVKKLVTSLLKEEGIIDYRISHELPYVKIGNSCYKANENGVLSKEKVPEYELSFALNRENVLIAYDYIKTYLEQEDEYINRLSAQASIILDIDFGKEKYFSNHFNRYSRGEQFAYNFISLFNSLPDTEDTYRNESVFSTISNSYKQSNSIPYKTEIDDEGERKRFELNDDLFKYDNPIFQEYFGANLKEEIENRKKIQQQRLFETAFRVIKNLTTQWPEISKQHEEIKSRLSILDEKHSKKNLNDEETVEYDALNKKERTLRERKSEIQSVITNYTYSVFNRRSNDYKIRGLTKQQKIDITQYVVADEHKAFKNILPERGYEKFCNYLDILIEQAEQFLSGDYELTPMMQVVADNIDYKIAHTQEELEDFSKNYNEYKNETAAYPWGLHTFDLIRYLSHSSKIDIREISRTLKKIKPTPSDGYDYNTREKKFYSAYKNLVTSDIALTSITHAIEDRSNYKNLSFDENISVINSLVSLNNQMSKLLGKEEKEDWRDKLRYDYNLSKIQEKIKYAQGSIREIFQSSARKIGIFTQEEKIEMRDKQFLSMLSERIDGQLRAAEKAILSIENPLERMEKLYGLYHGEERNYSSDLTRTDCLNRLAKKERNLEKISDLSRKDDFWPQDTLEHIKAFLFAKNTFLDDIELENTLLNKIFDKVEKLPKGKNKNECLYLLLDQKLRAAYPKTRQRLFDIYTQDIYEKLGKDDGSERYQNKLSVYLKAIEGDNSHYPDRDSMTYDSFISKTMSSADKYILLRQISDRILSQEKTSTMFKESCQVNLDAGRLQRSYLYGIGVDALTSDLDENPETANMFIQFFNSNGENSDCETISAYMQKQIKKKRRRGDGYYESDNSDEIDALLKEVSSVKCKVLYDNFWSAPLEARAVIIARLLKSAVLEKETDNENAWETVFDVVMDNIIHPDDDSIEARYAQDIMHSYIKSRSDYERELILSAMMVANRNIGADAGNVGKALKLFLENMGPAEIKLGQAISSHPNTPESIRVELQELKNCADLPARWTIYDWIKAENIPEEYWKNEYLGETLGSASYYTTVALGDDEVLRILRPEAREKAKKGFRVIGSTIDDLEEKDKVSDLEYKELTSSVQEMVKQASKMSTIETDHDIGEQQYSYAQEIYDGVIIHSGEETFSLEVMNWNAKGKNWMKLQRAEGILFNDLPENTEEEVKYKKKFAKGYITFEIMNILSGRKFDHDKHGAQLCINPENNKVGIFDTGAMALNDPTEQEQRLLGNVIYDAIKTSLQGDKSFLAFSRSITNKIDQLHKEDIDTQYLVEVKKGLLALGDFFNVLDENDIKEIIPGMDMLSQLSTPMQQGIYEKMSMVEKASLQVLSATDSFAGNKSVTILKENRPIRQNNVANVMTQPTVQDKSKWLEEILVQNEEIEQSGLPPSPQQQLLLAS